MKIKLSSKKSCLSPGGFFNKKLIAVLPQLLPFDTSFELNPKFFEIPEIGVPYWGTPYKILLYRI